MNVGIASTTEQLSTLTVGAPSQHRWVSPHHPEAAEARPTPKTRSRALSFHCEHHGVSTPHGNSWPYKNAPQNLGNRDRSVPRCGALALSSVSHPPQPCRWDEGESGRSDRSYGSRAESPLLQILQRGHIRLHRGTSAGIQWYHGRVQPTSGHKQGHSVAPTMVKPRELIDAGVICEYKGKNNSELRTQLKSRLLLSTTTGAACL